MGVGVSEVQEGGKLIHFVIQQKLLLAKILAFSAH